MFFSDTHKLLCTIVPQTHRLQLLDITTHLIWKLSEVNLFEIRSVNKNISLKQPLFNYTQTGTIACSLRACYNEARLDIIWGPIYKVS